MKLKYFFVLLIPVLFLLAGCSSADYAESGTLIVEADEVNDLLDAGYMFLDAQKGTSYGKGHVEGAPNMERASITVKEPVPNTLAPASIIEAAASKAGLSENDKLLIYDSNSNMDAARLFWTLKYYGHKGDIRIVSGGLNALKSEGFSIVKELPAVSEGNYRTSAPAADMMIGTEGVSALIEEDGEDSVIIDVRSDDEYYGGTIPGSVHINFENNNFKDSSFRPVQQIRILYKDHDIMPEDSIVMYCKTSIRAANTYAALYNAGYRNLKIYDAAWLGWSGSDNRVFTPEKEGTVSINSQDNS